MIQNRLTRYRLRQFWVQKIMKPYFTKFEQGAKVGTLGRQNESSYVRLAFTSIFGLRFMSVYLMKSSSYSIVYSSLGCPCCNNNGWIDNGSLAVSCQRRTFHTCDCLIGRNRGASKVYHNWSLL